MGLFELPGAWLPAIGISVLHSLWIGMLILALLRLVLSHVPSRLSGLRYSISVSALLILFISVLSVFLLVYEPAVSSRGAPGLQGAVPGIAFIELFSARSTGLSGSGLLFTLLGDVYLGGVLFMLCRSLRSLVYLRELQKRGTRPAREWQERFCILCNRLGIKRSVGFIESKLVSAPQLAALLKPVVIVPAGMLVNLPASQIEIILLHELYHIKRKDYLVNLAQLFIEAVLFYHPVVWSISALIRNEREHRCDDWVLSHTDNPVGYAKALLRVAEQQHYTRLAPGAVGSGKRQFYARIKRILNQHNMKTNMRDKVLTLTLLTVSLILVLSISGFRAAPSLTGHNKQHLEWVSLAADNTALILQDTIPDTISENTLQEDIREAREEALKEIEEIDWEAVREVMEEAREEALKEIEEIDLDAIQEDIKEAREEALREIEEIDWETIREEMEESREEALREIEEIDWEVLMENMKISMSEMKLDMEDLKMEIENAFTETEWEKIQENIEKDLEEARISLDSILIEMDR